MNGIFIFSLEILASLALSALVLARLQGRLKRLSEQICERSGGTDFWVAYTQLMMFIAPVLLVALFSRAGGAGMESLVAQLRSSLQLLMWGQFAGLLVMGIVIMNVTPAATPSTAATTKGEAS